jgi:hypothetical protein
MPLIEFAKPKQPIEGEAKDLTRQIEGSNLDIIASDRVIVLEEDEVREYVVRDNGRRVFLELIGQHTRKTTIIRKNGDYYEVVQNGRPAPRT